MACYTQVTSVTQWEPACTTETLELHRHQDSCYDSEGNLVCGYADFVVHQHDSNCYDENGDLWCPLPEIKTHKHNESCFAVISSEPHVHTDACYTMERGELICSESTEPAHVHTDDCYTETSQLICTEEHEHGEGCYETIRELTCGCTEEPAHQHSDQCYEQIKTLICDLSTEPAEDNGVQMLVCDKNEIILHEHTAECFDDAGNLTCGKIQVLEHQHDDACFAQVTVPVDTEALTCTLPEDENHTHTALCYGLWELTCGMEEHTHDEECSSAEDAEEDTDADIDLTADVETQEQWEQLFADLKLTGEWRQDVITVAKTQLGYTESTSNYIVLEDGSHRGYTRFGDWYGIPYGDWCAMFVSFCLNYAEIPREVIPYEANCQWWIEALEKEKYNLYRKAESYAPESGDLIFYDWEQDGVSDHVGLVVERIPATEKTPERLVAIEGNSSEQVRLVTYELDDPAIKGYGRLPEQTFYCGKQGHVHSSDCGGEGVCPLEEHIHTDRCKEPMEEDLTELTFEGTDYTVTVRYGADAELPEGVELVVTEISQDSQAYQDYYAQAAAAMETKETEQTVVFARFFDISFQIDGVEYEPAAPVSVTITYAQSVETDENSNYQTVHFSEDGTEILNVTVEQQEDGSTSFTHNQDGFSVVGTLVMAAYGINNTDIGPDVLPVDYFVHIDGQWVCVGSTKTGWYGDYTTTKWENNNRDCITVAQANSILGPYGFKPDATNAALQFAYQRKETHLNANLHCDTFSYLDTTKSNSTLLPLARNQNPRSGYNIYFLPGNTKNDLTTTLESVPTTGSDFYTVSIYNANGELLKKSDPILTGGSFTWGVTDDVTTWLAAYGDGHTETVSVTEGTLTLPNITSTVHVSPARGDVNSHSVTFKVLVDGQWKTVGSLPYYYTSNNTAYITSDMAAQFFGDYGYTAATDHPGYHFAYSYNDLYQIVYCDQNSKAPTNFCMDVDGANYTQGTAIQLYQINNSDAQLFRIRDAEAEGHEGYHYISPFKSSSLLVNLSGTGERNLQKLVLWNSPATHSSWKVISETNGTVSFQLKENSSFYIDVNNNTQKNSEQLQIYQNAGAKFWKLNQQYKISSSTNTQNQDDTWNIGSALETNGDIVCYYMPVAASETMTNLSEAAAAAMSGGSWYSVTVVDDTHGVYSDLELQELSQNVPSGTDVTITVNNADGILWSCRGLGDTPLDVTTTQSGGQTTFDIKAVNQPVEIVATQANPDFSVQYYCNIPRYATSGDTSLKVIDTTGGILPTNGGNMATKSLYLEGIGQNTNQNNGDSTPLYRVKTVTKLTKLYSEGVFQFESSPSLDYFNKLKENENYALKEIWILKDGKKGTSLNRDDWDIYPYGDKIAFTNEAGQVTENTILVQDGTVIRLVSDTCNGAYHNGTTFYDYNISSGQNSDGRWRTGITGINSKDNYTNAAIWESGANVLAFGNANCGTGMGEYLFDGNNLNKYNSKNSNYGGTTFGIAAGLNANGTIRYNAAIAAPKLFNEGDAQYKQTYSGSSLTFDRVGDTYTLSAATLNNSNGQSNTLSGLQYFFNPSPYSGKTHTHIFTNNFWPMDQAAGRTDALWGTYGNPGKFQGFNEGGNPTSGWSNNAADFPYGDDGRAHNWFFGMNFAISFSLTADYEGPLEYYFFGDDDLWVFLDQTLVCDIGGVHSSVGEYVNLRDYLPVGSEGQHTLSFFYTERGDTGSTCYMSFTLPSVSSATTSRDTGSLEIAKSVSDPANGDFTNEEYGFKVELLTDENGTALKQTFSYKLSDNTYGTIKSGGTIKLKAGQTATISGIPAGTYYRVTEAEESRRGYSTTVNNSQGYIVSGKIESGAVKPASFVNTPYCELPQTGGAGSKPYTIGGILLITGAAFLLLYNHFKRRKEGSVSS
ncbi:MAG: fibro-slime domain-containing protein [Oscillospiraceae bacterium]|nr:fibro-slime domain-containing protein [Oscillospiraceae bacterium]